MTPKVQTDMDDTEQFKMRKMYMKSYFSSEHFYTFSVRLDMVETPKPFSERK
jgi:hypothetical protein